MLFPKAPTSCGKKKKEFFLLHCSSICMSSKSVSQIFKTLFETGNINIFVFHGVLFSRYVQIKSSFPDKKNSAVKSEKHFSREAIED